jgi:uroporphyrinogen-III synthase
MDAAGAPRIVLTRPAGRNESLARTLREAGLEALEAPALRIEALDVPRPSPRPGDLLVFVSGQAVASYFGDPSAGGQGATAGDPQAGSSGCAADWPPGAWAGAVGPATGRALKAHVPADRILMPAAGHPPDSEALLAAIDGQGLPPARAHILRATRGRDWLAAQLRRRGWQVACHALYRRLPCDWDRRTCLGLSAAGAAVLLLTSAEALAAIESSLLRQDLPWPAALHVVTLHERIARRLQCRYADQPGKVLHVTLSSPDEAALFQAIVAATRQLSRRT